MLQTLKNHLINIPGWAYKPQKIKSQSIAFDFVFNDEDYSLIVEMSYGFVGPVMIRIQVIGIMS